MHYTLFTRRLVFGLLLIFMLVADWFLRGMVLAATHSEMEHSAYEGAIPQPGNVPICMGYLILCTVK